MAQTTDTDARLLELINQSEAIQSLEEKERKTQIEKMMAATPEQKEQLIAVFEQEKAELEQIDEEFLSHEEEINGLIAEIKQIKAAAERAERIAEENRTRSQDDEKADMLLKKLDDIL